MALLKIFVLQMVLFGAIVLVLWELLKRELVQAALRALEECPLRDDVTEVSVVAFAPLRPADERRLRAGLSQRFPAAKVGLTVDPDIRGGLVIKADSFLIDQSLLTRIQYLFCQKEA